MNTINTDFVRQNWQYKPEFSTADTSSLSNLSNLSNTITTCVSVPYMASEIQRRADQIIKEREAEMNNVKFNDLEKDLKELGIELSTIRHSAGEKGCEIEAYFNPEKYAIHLGRERLTLTPVHPVGSKPVPKKVKFSGPATIILWEDGTKTVVKCQKEDVWDDDVGIGMCYLKKMLGNKGNFNNIFREAMKVAEVQTKKEDLVK